MGLKKLAIGFWFCASLLTSTIYMYLLDALALDGNANNDYDDNINMYMGVTVSDDRKGFG